MDLPKISIIIPVYNVEPYIAECLQSVIRQTYQGPMECIVVDDCGTDKSIEIAEQIIAGYDGPVEFRLLSHKRNKGLSAGRNTGVASATGDYIFFLDSDDYISEDCLTTLTKPLCNMDYDIVVGDIQTFGNSTGACFISNDSRSVIGRGNIFDELCYLGTTYIMACNKLVKASLFRNNDLSFLEGQIHEDELWSYKTTLVAESMFVQRSITYFYRMHKGSITSDYNKNVEKRMQSRCATLNFVLDHPSSVDKAKYDAYVLQCFDRYVRGSFRDDVDFRKDFVNLRRKFNYHPLSLLLKGKMPLDEVKHQMHFFLPAKFGYFWLMIRRKKKEHQKKNKR